MGMGRAECTDSAILQSTNNSTIPGMPARAAIRKKSSRVIKEPYLFVSTGVKYRLDGAQGGSVCLIGNLTCQKLVKLGSIRWTDTTGRPQKAKNTHSRHKTLPYAIVVNAYGIQGHGYGQG